MATTVLGTSGRDMLSAVLAGEQHPETLADLARGKLRAGSYAPNVLRYAKPWTVGSNPTTWSSSSGSWRTSTSWTSWTSR